MRVGESCECVGVWERAKFYGWDAHSKKRHFYGVWRLHSSQCHLKCQYLISENNLIF